MFHQSLSTYSSPNWLSLSKRNITKWTNQLQIDVLRSCEVRTDCCQHTLCLQRSIPTVASQSYNNNNLKEIVICLINLVYCVATAATVFGIK